MITDAIHKLVERVDLTEDEARGAMDLIMRGEATDAQIAGFLTALRMKGETVDELVGFASVMRQRAEPVWDGSPLDVVDTCGTGGDRSGTFNISTAAAFVVAGAGIRVAKHGNRSISSRCGSADVLEALGVDIQMPVERIRRALRDVCIAFLFAPRFHPAMKHVMPARTQLKTRTVFNILGPLANPAGARRQVIGVMSLQAAGLMAQALRRLGAERAFVVHGADGIDEISISGPTHMEEVGPSGVSSQSIHPNDLGLDPAPHDALAGGDTAGNARIIESILNGERGPRRDVVLMNAAAAIVAGGAADDLKTGARLAAHSIDSGEALRRLQALREFL